MRSTKLVITAALALTGALAAGMAQAHDDVQWSVTLGSSTPVYTQPVPVYRPAPVIVTPAPVYRPAPVVVAAPVYRHPTYWDRDGDGIPNRYDRRYNPAWDRDGDGIPNRYDRVDNRWHDRDHDGIPDWRDHHDNRRW
jgi:hypothetical protein